MQKHQFILILCCVLFFGCEYKRQPEFYINGKPYYTSFRCIEEKTEIKWEYHYGYNVLGGTWNYHYGPRTQSECLKYVIDTIEIK